MTTAKTLTAWDLYDRAAEDRKIAEYRLWLVERLANEIEVSNPKLCERLRRILKDKPSRVEDVIGGAR